MTQSNPLCKQAHIQHPIICGAMYPCSNPELVAAVSAAGGIGIIQPLSLVFVHKHGFVEGLRYMKSLTDKPLGMNLILEESVKKYRQRNEEWLERALQEGVRFFVTSLGNPQWVVKKVKPLGGIVYHDVTELKWAKKAVDNGVDGLICVNDRAGGHAGAKSARQLFADLSRLHVPLVCAGGVSTRDDYMSALQMGYAGVQLGTRFIATDECQVHQDYKDAIVKAGAEDIVLTEKISGVPVAVIRTAFIEKSGTQAGRLTKILLKHRKLKHLMRAFYSLRSIWQLKQASQMGSRYQDYFQAGKSVEGVHSVMPVAKVFEELLG